MKVKFLQDRTVQDLNAGTNREVRYKAGQVVDLAEASANHWITRGVAEPIEDKPTTASKPAAGSKPGGTEGANKGE